jgi:hypothetical protein
MGARRTVQSKGNFSGSPENFQPQGAGASSVKCGKQQKILVKPGSANKKYLLQLFVGLGSSPQIDEARRHSCFYHGRLSCTSEQIFFNENFSSQAITHEKAVELFNRFDVNRSGTLSLAEVDKVY